MGLGIPGRRPAPAVANRSGDDNGSTTYVCRSWANLTFHHSLWYVRTRPHMAHQVAGRLHRSCNLLYYVPHMIMIDMDADLEVLGELAAGRLNLDTARWLLQRLVSTNELGESSQTLQDAPPD